MQKLGLLKTAKTPALNKMEEVRQAELEERMIAKRAAAAELLERGLVRVCDNVCVCVCVCV